MTKRQLLMVKHEEGEERGVHVVGMIVIARLGNRWDDRPMKTWWMSLAMLLGAWNAPADDTIELLVRADDMGVSQAVNAACVESYRNGIARSVEVIVPGPWFMDAVRLLRANPGCDVGIHLCLTSEWERCKWAPLTRAQSLVGEDGYFHPMTRQRSDFPPGTGFVEAKPKLAEVEAELRAQIEKGRRHIKNVTHLSAHMGAATATPELTALTERLAEEYHLPLRLPGVNRASGFKGRTPEEKERALVDMLEHLTPGRWLLVEHPGLDTPEMRALGHKGYENVAEDRVGVTHAFTSPKVLQTIERRGIKLINYRDANETGVAR